MQDDDDSELFEGKIEITRTENGASFGLDEETYFRMAQTAMTAGGMGIEPALICRLSGSGERGCRLVCSVAHTRSASACACSEAAGRSSLSPSLSIVCVAGFLFTKDQTATLTGRVRCAPCVPSRELDFSTRTGRKSKLSSSRAKTDRDGGAGKPKGSGTGYTVEVKSVSMTPESWRLLDQMRGSLSRGVWISARVWRDSKARFHCLLLGFRMRIAAAVLSIERGHIIRNGQPRQGPAEGI